MGGYSKTLKRNLNWNKEISLTIAGLFFTLLGALFLFQDLFSLDGSEISPVERYVFALIAFCFVYANLVYLLSRYGFLRRDKEYSRHKHEDPELFFKGNAPSLSILVPSYKEEIRVIHQTLLSAALQNYPEKNIVLLIDDPPAPGNDKDSDDLTSARALPDEIMAFLEKPRMHYEAAKEDWVVKARHGLFDLKAETQKLAALFEDAARYLEAYTDRYTISDHTDRFFIQNILGETIKKLRNTGRSLLNRLDSKGSMPDENELLPYYNKLLAPFTATITSFERKGFENLSHEKNKAMNINSYISLVGKALRKEKHGNNYFLEESTEDVADLFIPDTKYIITLDADTLVMPDYALRLAAFMEQKGNERLAVVQTPYSAIPGSGNFLERVAGATTDVQLIIHQGFTWANATYWVGANAMLRKEALEDIKFIEQERGHSITRYIHDRTVIEDTESSIDMIDKGWSLHNLPERLAYSATPPDYGSLLIQRRRWANGGLIIMPKLIRHTVRNFDMKKLSECIVRLHYLISITTITASMLAVILYPFNYLLWSPWLFITALPYFYFYGRDLNLSGYSWSYLGRVCMLNLTLIPINLGGVLKSIQQGIRKQKIPFVRTPKIGSRTSAPPLYIIAQVSLFFFCVGAGLSHIAESQMIPAGFKIMIGLFFAYGHIYFIGLRESLEDLWVKLEELISIAGRISVLQPGKTNPILPRNNGQEESDGYNHFRRCSNGEAAQAVHESI